MSLGTLTVDNLYLRFGGLVATDDVSLDVKPGELHAIIGPNGAGKTTLIAQLAGDRRPDSGVIRLNDEDVTQLPANLRARRGLGRSYQITSIFSEFTTLQNVMLAAQVRSGHSFRFWRQVDEDKSLIDPAMAVLEKVGLASRAKVAASALAHGEKRALELAIALATLPQLLLLDEPMAGMGPDEATRMIELLAKLKGTITMVLIEHDMDAVFTLADRISVLVYGRIVATGTPSEIKCNTDVRQAYLGEDEG